MENLLGHRSVIGGYRRHRRVGTPWQCKNASVKTFTTSSRPCDSARSRSRAAGRARIAFFRTQLRLLGSSGKHQRRGDFPRSLLQVPLWTVRHGARRSKRISRMGFTPIIGRLLPCLTRRRAFGTYTAIRCRLASFPPSTASDSSSHVEGSGTLTLAATREPVP